MKRALAIVALGTVVLAGAAIAQSPPPIDRTPIVQHPSRITAEQGYIIKENVLKGAGTVGQETAATGVEIGAKTPANVTLHDFPPFVIEKVPAMKAHKFFVVGNQVVIVSPSNTIADIIK